MTAFVASNGAINNYDGYTGGSTNATLDTYTISNDSTLLVRSDTYACANHTVAFGSLDTVSFTGTGGTLRFDPTFVRVIAYTGGSGNSPAYGATISQGGVSGIFLGAWENWQSEPAPASTAISATGFMKIGGVTGGSFSAGALTGITATCSGPDVQGWIEVRGADTATIAVPRVGKVESVEAWFEIGTTNGTRGQVISCPTTATVVGIFPGVWIETAPGSGIYDRYAGAGSQVALSTTRTDASVKLFKQTASGIVIGNDGTNGVYYLPPAGCKVRIPATLLTCCTRTTSGSGKRVLPNATLTTRQEFVTTSAGYIDLRGCVSMWYMNMQQAFYTKFKSCAISDFLLMSKISSPIDVDDCIVAPTQAQIQQVFSVQSCFSGGTVKNSNFWRFSLDAAGAYVANISYTYGLLVEDCSFGSITLRANAGVGTINSTLASRCTFRRITHIGAGAAFGAASNCLFEDTSYYDHTITTTTASTNPMHIWNLSGAGSNNKIKGIILPLPANGPYTGLIRLNGMLETTIQEIGTSRASPLVLNASVTAHILTTSDNCDGVYVKRCYVSNTRTGLFSTTNASTNVIFENVYGDYANTTVIASLNSILKGCGLTGATNGQISVYGTHWETRFTSLTAGFLEILCNEPTVASASQCAITGGTPQFNSGGTVLLTKVGDQVTWTIPSKILGFTAFTNANATITGTNVTYSSGARYGNHDIEFQLDTGSGYSGTWSPLNGATISALSILPTGFSIKIRATCAVASATNALTNLLVAMTTTQVAQDGNLYPLSVNTITFTGLPTGTDTVVLTSGTSTILDQRDALAGTTYAFTYEGTPTVDVGFIKSGYVPFYIRNLSLGSTDTSIPVSLTADRNYQ